MLSCFLKTFQFAFLSICPHLVSMATKNRSHFFVCPLLRQPRERKAMRPEHTGPGSWGGPLLGDRGDAQHS